MLKYIVCTYNLGSLQINCTLSDTRGHTYSHTHAGEEAPNKGSVAVINKITLKYKNKFDTNGTMTQKAPLPHGPTLSTRVLPLSVCVYLSRHTHTHAHIESSQNGTTLAVNNTSSTRSCLQGASRVCVCMSAWVSVCVCVVRECGLCHVRHFVTYFLSFVSCVFASFSASLVSGDSSSSSLHVTHTHIRYCLHLCWFCG